jgi:hypothetical protein
MTFTRTILPLAALLALSACGGGGGRDGPTRAFATGPIQAACLQADRRAASIALCGCVQAVANAELSGSDRGRVPRFFRDPHQAQVTRQSDRASDEAFWDRYRAFVTSAERRCA